jgi:uncharacterized protein
LDESTFEWDEEKRESNLSKHGIDFIDAAAIFDQNFINMADERRDYGETRFKALGIVDGIVMCVIYTFRENRYRIISAYKAGKNDRRNYSSIHDGRNQSDEGSW